MPNCGRKTQAILDELKACAGIISAPLQISDRQHKTKGHDGGHEETDARVVQSNLVTVYQNFYSPGSAVQGAVLGAFPGPVHGTGVCSQQPHEGVAFDSATKLGMSLLSLAAAYTQPLPPSAHTVPTEQANVHILPESSDQLVTGTKVPPLVEDSGLLTQHSNFEPEEQQPKVVNESTINHTTVHNANDESRNEGAALLAACMNSEWDVGKALVNSGSFLEARSHPDRKTPLLHTCIKGEVAFVKYLVKEYADVTAEDSHGRCCLHFHEVLRNKALMEYLLPIFTLLDISIDVPDENKCTPLLAACILGDSVAHSVQLLLKHKANPDGNNHAQCRPLVEASARGHERTVKLLLQYNANPDIQDVSGCTALLKACNCRQSNIIHLLLEHEVSVNRSDHDGTTPLFSAVSSNACEVVRQLIQKGAHINITRYRTNPMMSGAVEETPLAQACARGFLEIVELLILYGADVNCLCSGTVPPLGFAIIGNQMHIVKYLLENSDINKSLRGLRASIVIAVKVQNIACAKVMITELGGEEKTLMTAKQQNMYQLAEHIESYMALGDYNPVQAHVQDPSYYKTGEVMQSFSEVCVAAVISVVTREGTASVIADQHRCAGEFLNRCINGTQHTEMLRPDLMSGDPSPFKFFIDNHLLTAENFQIRAFHRYGNHAFKFCDELVKTFRQLPGGESLPNNFHNILKRLFSGQLCLRTSSGNDFWEPPHKPCPWRDFGHTSLKRKSQQSPIPLSDKKLFKEAMKEGYINASFIKIIFTGAGGVGKTHAVCLLRGVDPPDPNHRQSTDCVTKAVTLRVDAASDEKWEEMDLEKRKRIIAEGICAARESFILKKTTPTPSRPAMLQPQPEPKPKLEQHQPKAETKPKSEQHQPEAETKPKQEQRQPEAETKPKPEQQQPNGETKSKPEQHQPEAETKPKPEQHQPEAETNPKAEQQQQKVEPRPKLEQQQPQVDPNLQLAVQQEQPLETELDLVQCIHEAVMSGEVSGEVLGTKWVYAVDTGGQPPFHELLSAFIEGASVCVFVFKLSESLDHRPLVEYWVDGMEVGQPFEHPFSHRSILEQSLQTIQALPNLSNVYSKSEYSMSPLLLVIGTHRDKQDECPNETLEAKEKTLYDIVQKSGCNFLYNSHHDVERVVFDVNAKNPEQRDKEMASTLRRVIANRMPEPKKIPLRHYGLELELEHLATTKGVISMEECRAIGDRLNFNEEGLKAALRFLHRLNVLLYYPEVKEVEELIFCDPLILIKIVSMVVAYIHQIKLQYEGATKEWKDSCERGLITIEQLNTTEFRSCFRQIFTPKSLFKLFQHLLIVAMVREKDELFFMPCLLDELKTADLKKYRPHSDHCIPLTFQFHRKGKSICAPSGLFSALVAFLLSFKDRKLKSYFWMIAENSGKLYRNILRFRSYSPTVDITLINFHTRFEVFGNCQPSVLHKHLPKIRGTILEGLDEVNMVRKFKNVDYNEAFTCKCPESKKKPHLAEIDMQEKSWCCPYNIMLGGPLEATELVWYGESLSSGVGGSSCGGTAGFSKLQYKRDKIIRNLADLKLTRELSEKLFGADVITSDIYDQAQNYAPGVVEVNRATVLFNAVLTGVKLNPAIYDKFMSFLKEIRGSEDIVALIEGTEPCRQSAGARFNSFAPTVGGIPMNQEHGHKHREPRHQSSFEPLKEKEQEQSSGGTRFNSFAPTVGGIPMNQEHGHKHREPRHQSSFEPLKEKEQEQSSDSANTGGATRQTGATASQRETEHHESSDPFYLSFLGKQLAKDTKSKAQAGVSRSNSTQFRTPQSMHNYVPTAGMFNREQAQVQPWAPTNRNFSREQTQEHGHGSSSLNHSPLAGWGSTAPGITTGITTGIASSGTMPMRNGIPMRDYRSTTATVLHRPMDNTHSASSVEQDGRAQATIHSPTMPMNHSETKTGVREVDFAGKSPDVPLQEMADERTSVPQPSQYPFPTTTTTKLNLKPNSREVLTQQPQHPALSPPVHQGTLLKPVATVTPSSSNAQPRDCSKSLPDEVMLHSPHLASNRESQFEPIPLRPPPRLQPSKIPRPVRVYRQCFTPEETPSRSKRQREPIYRRPKAVSPLARGKQLAKDTKSKAQAVASRSNSTQFQPPQSELIKQLLQNNPEMKGMIKKTLSTNVYLGYGSYGEVVEVVSPLGTVYAAKKFWMSQRQEQFLKMFVKEVKLLSRLNHPNIVKYHGISIEARTDALLLLMERLQTNLSVYLLSDSPPDYPRKLSILKDVAAGLSYLHAQDPAIIHRDLTAKNVLLDSHLRAKIADFGNARIAQIDSGGHKTMTGHPGTQPYMPPEACQSEPRYNKKIDVFSFGHLALFAMIQEFPEDILPYKDFDQGFPPVVRTEIQRREKYMQKLYQELDERHPLVTMIKKCLHDLPRERPSAYTVVSKLEDIIAH